MVFNHANVPFDLWDMFILGAKIEADFAEYRLKRFKFQIGKCRSNVEPTSAVGLDHLAEGCSDSRRNLMASQEFNSTKVQAPGHGDKKGKLVDEH